MFQDVDRLTELGVLISLIVTLIGGLAAWLKRSVNRGMVTSDDLKKILDNEDKEHPLGIKQQFDRLREDGIKYTDREVKDLKAYMNEKDTADKKWLSDLQGKVEQNGKDTAELRGKIG